MSDTEVLIAGAGPTGLVLALWLTKAGIRIRLIDQAEKAGTTSRALVMHARNLEFYHQMGIEQSALGKGIEFRAANLWVRGRKAGRVPFSRIGSPVSPYPFMFILPQDRHEEMLTAELTKLGIEVERNTELLSYQTASGGIQARLRMPGGQEETATARYLAGCDGAHSVIRRQLGTAFPGGTYENTYYVADLVVEGPVADGEMHVALDDADFLAVFPMKGEGRVRMIGALDYEGASKDDLKWQDVSPEIIRRLRIDVKEVKWFSTYRVHHRVAAFFRKDRVFLLGDAGHIHSPVGGQGMNTGIGDAVNLAWKLASSLRQGAGDALLDTYESERIRFARTLVATTDRAFTFVNKRGWLAARVRTVIVPRLIPFLFRFTAIRRFLFRIVSQIRISYRTSPLSLGLAGKRRAGDRLPWVPASPDNFEPLRSMSWQAHCYGSLPEPLRSFFRKRNIALHEFAWSPLCRQAGLRKDAVYLIRPDGYIGLIERKANLSNIQAYTQRWHIGQ